jgi:hypothetical protein
MILDNTDVKKTWAPDLNNDGTPEFKLAMDIGLSHSWFAGGALYKALSRLDDYAGFSDWESALTWLDSKEPWRWIAEVQYWGHGSPGRVWMDKQALTSATPGGSYIESALLRSIARRLRPDSLVWFRTCSTFAGKPGHDFARAWSNALGCRVAAYTHIIGPFQSGLHTAYPRQEPSWPLTEGIEAGTPEQPTKLKWSGPFAPNTVTCLRGSIPKGY